MDKKQCERMFEQMQPPEAVVQRLQQRIHRLRKNLEHQKQPNHLFCSIRDRICRKWRLSIRTG